MQAVQMVGGPIHDKDHVWAIAFPLQDTNEILYPANARGLLQVIRKIQQEPPSVQQELLRAGCPTPTGQQYNLDAVLSFEERHDLHDTGIPSYAFENYKQYYTHYCSLSMDFLKQEWRERSRMSTIESDCNPLGFSTRRTTISKEAGKACPITDWNTAKKDYADDFGARAFLINNLPVKNILDVRMMRFDHPKYQRLPDMANLP
jgi:hypothetical protein